jgi:hypothetical protein
MPQALHYLHLYHPHPPDLVFSFGELACGPSISKELLKFSSIPWHAYYAEMVLLAGEVEV